MDRNCGITSWIKCPTSSTIITLYYIRIEPVGTIIPNFSTVEQLNNKTSGNKLVARPD